MKLLYGFPQNFWLVDFRQSYVYIQNMNTVLLLADSLLENIVHVILFKSLLEALLAGGIDSLPD